MKVIGFNEYQSEAKKTAVYPVDKAVEYLTLGLSSEAGEVADKVKKSIRDGHQLNRTEMAKELGDVLWYVANLSDVLGLDLLSVVNLNIVKLQSRQERGVLVGSGDNR